VITVGLTGNLSCGKSTIARRLRELGAVVVDADALVHAALAKGGEAVPAVLARFPGTGAGRGGVDRAALAKLVFADEAARRDLEALLHPIVWRHQANERERARAQGASVFVVEAALLYEAWRNGGADPRSRFDVIVVVTCDPRVQLERAIARHPLTSAGRRADAEREVNARLLAQMPQAEKAALADIVLDNSGDPEEARARADLLFSDLERRAIGSP
jgi:dephospho-CoA kinase